MLDWQDTSIHDVEALQEVKNPVDLLSKSRPRKKPKPKGEAKPSEKKGSPSSKERGDQKTLPLFGKS